MLTEKQRIRAVFLLVLGGIFLISGIADLSSLFIVHNSESFGTVIASFSILAGIYFLLDAYLVKRNKRPKD
ncbi:MAG: hypothetical protein AMDU4_FER2C00086G0038 [Ferroplasma sp. Type II]|uniref:hypothetical protein n=1 Tax=Ferroplasma sp. Type II TaxID=261388 RepID=UPI00038964C2|nr:hypothetical protein [Ferroplasma sp. Type II]EQB70649.1 MAG: hypothetical protein AMDU4_FER2C00236G0003 [Ferroplasma sp. Type II]EQB73252.1 MAG: hypothetical protein AMDU4_FER2C00086G0038 [Ferroplasma sp. Type II]